MRNFFSAEHEILSVFKFHRIEIFDWKQLFKRIHKEKRVKYFEKKLWQIQTTTCVATKKVYFVQLTAER